jgi:predicted HD phosphohydrolase
MTSTTSFSRMDQSTAAQWEHITRTGARNRGRVAETILRLLGTQATLNDGFAVTQLVHGLQTAARAEAAGADDELVVAALCHDIGKAITVPNHAAVAAEILRPYVRAEVAHVILAHQDFQSRYYNQHYGGDLDRRARWREAEWYGVAEAFADEWDQMSFDPAFPTPALSHYEPLVRRVFAEPRYFSP